MFSLVKETKKDVCSRCKKQILDIDNFSIDHKIPWLDSENPKKLFFDLENISFSHTGCNYGNARQPNKIIYPPGYGWCASCKQFKFESEFPLSKKRDRKKHCSKCGTKQRLKWRELNGRR